MTGKELLLERINTLPAGGTDRKIFISEIKRIENSILDFLREETMSGWSLGKGIGTANDLSHLRDIILDKIIEFSGGVPDGISILAIGGYGRNELSPYSDIDLLILHTEKAPVERFMHEFATNLWDCGYHVGHSVRTLANLASHAREDMELLTGLFEARLLKGDSVLFSGMEKIRKKSTVTFRVNYLKSRIEEINSVSCDPASEILLKEPEIKKSIGGLRSVHIMEWLNYTFTGMSGLAGLKSILSAMYYKRTYVAYDFLLFIRCFLHLDSGRKNDRFLMNDHFAVSGLFFHSGSEASKTAKLMKKYYGKAEDIFLSLMFIIQEFHLKYIKGKNLSKRRPSAGRGIKNYYETVNKSFYIREGLGFSIENAMETVYAYSTAEAYFTFSLIHYLKECTRKINNDDRKSRQVFGIFRKILSLDSAGAALTVMKYSGLLYEYITPLKKIRHLIIYNPYHQFTVDEHVLESVRALAVLRSLGAGNDPKDRVKFGHFSEICSYYQKNIWVIRLALLLHDAGKAYEGDHSKNGFEMAAGLFKALPLKRMEKDLILFLIDNHLLLSNLIRRSSISDPVMLRDCATKFVLTPFPREYFDSLYMVTYCDIYATKSENFKSYMAELLALLYGNVLPFIVPELKAQGQKPSAPLMSRPMDEIADFVAGMGASYQAQYGENEIIEDYSTVVSIKGPEIRIRVRSYNDYFKVKMFAADRKGLFSFFCGILALNGADIVSAAARTYRGTAVDEFTVTRIFGFDYAETMKDELDFWTKELEKLIKTHRDNGAGLEQAIDAMKKKIKKSPAVFSRKPEIQLENRGGGALMLEINCMDRPALLFETAGYISKTGIEILSAHIDTKGWYVHDIFELDSGAGRGLDHEEKLKIIEELSGILSRN